ncbi:MAG: hypothetical protein ACYCUG_16485 [Acidimicrobiales bacterium]
MLDVFVYPDRFVVAVGSAEGALLRGGGAALGLAGATAGWAAADAMDWARVRREAAGGADALLARNPHNRDLPFATVRSASLTRHLPGSRLVLEMAEGPQEKFEWKRTYNDHDAVARLLTAALGPKLRLG